MFSGIQFSGKVPARGSRRWFTHSWPANWQVIWNVVPLTANTEAAQNSAVAQNSTAAQSSAQANAAPQINWQVEVERSEAERLTYWVTVRNLTALPVEVEGRFIVLNQEG